MPRAVSSFVAWLVLIFVVACGPAALPPSGASPPRGAAAVGAPPSRVAAPLAGAPAGAGELGPVPVTQADPARGSSLAPVTLVVFSDFECPFCKHLSATLDRLAERYGPEQLRVVWKNYPLAFHRRARPSAEAAMAVFADGGPSAFWAFHDTIFGAEGRLSPALEEAALKRAGVSAGAVERLRASGAAARKVDEDVALATRLGVDGTPASFINGVLVTGAQPIEVFAAAIDEQLEAARALRAQGTPPGQIYAALTRRNLESTPPPREAADEDDEEQEDKSIHLVPVGDSPVRGQRTALVTVVMFGDYECPFCVRVMPTIDRLASQYGDKLRFVWKDNPLTFHKRAEPAAELAREARAQRGDGAFWQAHARLMTEPRNLTDEALEATAAALKLNVAAVKRAIAARKHAAAIEADMDLAEDLEARGTPTFFINGRRLVGAQPIDKFVAIIDEEIVKAEALVAGGTPRAGVYEALQRNATPPPAPPQVALPAPGKDAPSKGAAGAKVIVQAFSDFQCPYCARAATTLDELITAFPGSVRVVFRNLPLPMHAEAALAAEAAMEAFAQKGSAGFWKMHDLLFSETSSANLDRAALERHAAILGLDMARFTAALDARTHKSAVEAEAKAAQDAGIRGTPGFVINGYLVSGAQPLRTFKKVVRRALAEAKTRPPN